MFGRRDDERVLRSREQLRFKVFSAVRDVALGTRLFRANFQLHEPEITVNVYPRFVHLDIALNEAQLHLLPLDTRPRDLTLFANELQQGIGKVAAGLKLELTVDPSKFGGSEPILAGSSLVGFRAVLLRPDSE